MTTPYRLEADARKPEGTLEHSPGASLFAQVEGLAGEEQELLVIPAHERKPHEHERLRAVGEELDRVFEHLRERAGRREDKTMKS
jgi:Protein of unknown function (DUF2630)